MDLAKKWLAWDQHWRQQATFVMRYESMMADPVGTIAALPSPALNRVDREEIHRR